MDIQPHKINPDLLPQLLQDLVEVIGLCATLKLAKRYNGRSFYVPSKAHQDHPIAQIIGQQDLAKLAKVYAQETLRMPKIDAAERQIKHQVVADMKASNLSINDTALATGYSTRRVEQLRAQSNVIPPQNDLFTRKEVR